MPVEKDSDPSEAGQAVAVLVPKSDTDWMLEAQKTGLRVFPVHIRPGAKGKIEKKPLIVDWQHAASTEVERFDWSKANGFGILMGDGLFAFDVDSWKPGCQADVWLEAQGLLVPTRTHRTVSGGQHRIFQTPEGEHDTPTGAGIVPGLDTRGAGGFIAFGEGYRVLDSAFPAEVPVSVCRALKARAKSVTGGTDKRIEVPATDRNTEVWVRDLMTEHPDLAKAMQGAGKDGSETLLWVAAVAHRVGLTEDQFAEVVMGAGWGEAARHVMDQMDPARALGRAWARSAPTTGADEFAGALVPDAEAPSAKAAREAREQADIFGVDVETAAAAAAAAEVVRELGPFQRRMADAEVVAGSLAGFDPLSMSASVLKGLVPQTGLGLVYGATGIGKSFVVMDWLLRMAGGRDWHGHRNKARSGDWIYVSSEGGTVELKRRLSGWVAANGAVLPAGAAFYATSFKWGADTAEVERFIRWCKGRGRPVRGVVIDTLNRNMAGDENTQVDMTAFVDRAEEVWRALDCVVLVVHHEGKNSDLGARGSSVLPAATEFEWRIFRDQGSFRGGIKITKNRNGEDGQTYWFELERHVFGRDADGDDVSTLVVKRAARGPAKTHTRKLSKALVAAYETVAGSNGWADLGALCTEAADWHKTEYPDVKRPAPSELKREVEDQLVGKCDWERMGDAVKSPDFKEM